MVPKSVEGKKRDRARSSLYISDVVAALLDELALEKLAAEG